MKKTLESLLIILENKGYDVDGPTPNFMVHESLIENIGGLKLKNVCKQKIKQQESNFYSVKFVRLCFLRLGF